MSDFDVTKDTWLRREDISFDRVRSILEVTGLDVVVLDAELLLVKGRVGGECLVLSASPETAVVLGRAPVQFKDSVDHIKRLECVNTINASFMGVRAYLNEDDFLTFGHEICMPAGLPETVFILDVIGFCARVNDAIKVHALPLLETE